MDPPPDDRLTLIGRRRSRRAMGTRISVATRGDAAAYWEAVYRVLIHRSEWQLALLDLDVLQGAGGPTTDVERHLLADRRDWLRRRAATWSSRRARMDPADAALPAEPADLTGSWQDQSALESVQRLDRRDAASGGRRR